MHARLSLALLASSALLAPAAAMATPTWHAMTTQEPYVTGGTSVSCTMGDNCDSASSVADGKVIAACVVVDSGNAKPGKIESVDTDGVTVLRDGWSMVENQSSFGNAQTILFYTVTHGLSAGQSIRYTTDKNDDGSDDNIFGGLLLANLDGFTGTPLVDGHAGAAYGDSTSDTASGAVTGGRKHDAAFGCAASKFGGTTFVQATGFGSPPGFPGGDEIYVGGTTVDTGSTPSTFNFHATSSGQDISSAALMLLTTEPPAFSAARSSWLLGMGAAAILSTPQDPKTVPAQAAGVGYTNLTFSIDNFADGTAKEAPYTVDQALAYKGHPRLYYGRSFFQTPQPDHTTLQGPDGALVGESAGNYQQTFSTFTTDGLGGQGFKGVAFGGGAYFQSECAYTSTNAANGQWTACLWDYTAECETDVPMLACEFPGFDELADESDGHEGFDGNFSVLGAVYCSTKHDHWDDNRDNGSQDLHCFTETIPFYETVHKFGDLWVPATETTQGYDAYYLDDALQATSYYDLFGHDAVAAGPISTASADVTLASNPNATRIVAPFYLTDTDAGCVLGQVSTISGINVVLASHAACNGVGSSDHLVFTPPTPSAIQTGGNYVSATGVATFTVASASGLVPGELVNFAPTSTGGGNLAGEFLTIAGTGGATIKLQLPTGLGDSTITGGDYTPTWQYGAQDRQHLDLIVGCMDSPHQCTLRSLKVWQRDFDHNLVAN